MNVNTHVSLSFFFTQKPYGDKRKTSQPNWPFKSKFLLDWPTH